MENKYHILATRTMPAISMEIAAQHGIGLRYQPFIRTESVVTTTLKKEITALLQTNTVSVFTSENAVNSIRDFAQPTQVCCLSGATLTAVQEAFPQATILITGDNGASLASAIIASGTIQSALFFCGNKRRDELPDLLSQHNIALKEFIVYETLPFTEASQERYDGILFFSPSAVEVYFTHYTTYPDTVYFAIGHTTAAALQQYSDNVIVNQDKPNSSNLLQTAITYFNNHKQD